VGVGWQAQPGPTLVLPFPFTFKKCFPCLLACLLAALGLPAAGAGLLSAQQFLATVAPCSSYDGSPERILQTAESSAGTLPPTRRKANADKDALATGQLPCRRLASAAAAGSGPADGRGATHAASSARAR
jgi:hypothetical protein